MTTTTPATFPGSPSMAFTNPYTPGATDFNAVMPALMNVINGAASKANTAATTSPMEEHKSYLRELPAETRTAIEASETYQLKKMEMMQNFLIWCIGGTDLGAAFCNGPGAGTVKELTAIAKQLEPQVGKLRDQEVENLKAQVEQLKQVIVNQQNSAGSPDIAQQIGEMRREFDSLRERLGDTANG